MKHETVLVAVLHDVHILASRDSLLAPLACNGMRPLKSWLRQLQHHREGTNLSHSSTPMNLYALAKLSVTLTFRTLVATELKLLTSALPRNFSAQPWRHPKSPHSSNWIGALNRQCSSEFRSPSPKWRRFALDHRHMLLYLLSCCLNRPNSIQRREIFCKNTWFQIIYIDKWNSILFFFKTFNFLDLLPGTRRRDCHLLAANISPPQSNHRSCR